MHGSFMFKIATHCCTLGHVSRDCPQPKKEKPKCKVCGWFATTNLNCTNCIIAEHKTQSIIYMEMVSSNTNQ